MGSFSDEYLELRKKRLEEMEEEAEEGEIPVAQLNDIAPVSTMQGHLAAQSLDPSPKALDGNDGRQWINTSAFDDGYQFGDVVKSAGATVVDVGENLGAGIIGMGEALLDGLMMLGTAMNRQYMMQAAESHMIYNTLSGNNAANDGILTQYQGYQAEVEKSASEFVAKDLYDENEVAKTIITNPIESVTGLDVEHYSVSGEKLDSVAQSGGQLLATAGLQAVGVPWWLTTGVTSYGSQAEVALNDGATFDEANMSALITAGAEILTEKLSGGIKFGGKTWDEALTKKLATAISDKFVRNAVNIGVGAIGEGGEEVVSQLISNLGTALYKEEDLGEIMASEEALEEYIDAFLGGAILGGVSSTGNTVISNAKGVDSATGLTNNEQAVVEKEIENRIAEAEADGEKLTNKQKADIRQKVFEDIEKGYISTDVIESVLGGEDYSNYQNELKRQQDIDNELKELRNMKSGDMTDIQIERMAELKAMKPNTEMLNTLKYGIDEKIRNALTTDGTKLKDRGSFLAESYNEQTRRGQAYEADLSQYDSKQAEVVKKAIESKILNNTRRTHDFVDMVAKISADKGVLFDFTNNQKLKESGFAVDGKFVNGYVTKDGITVNMDSAKYVNAVVGHEITHVLEGTEFYNELQNTLFEYAKSKGEYQSRLDTLTKLYEGVKDADVNAELTADLVGDYLFTDSKFISRLSTTNRNVFQKIYDEIKYLYKMATAGSKEARQLEKVKRAFDKAYRESGKTEGTKYSLDMVEAVKPTSNKWVQGATTDEVRAAHPTLYAVDEDATEQRNPTQVKGTVNSYRKIYDTLKQEGFDGTILDASSGLGYGTKAGVEEYGFKVEDIEPYPDSSYKPKYTDYSSLNKTYDVVISNAVLNVIPQDQRDALVVKMGELLNPGGRMFINVRGKDVLNSSGKIAINEANMEYFIPRTAKTGSYQKGFTKPELVAYLQDALGDGYTVEPTNMFGAVSAIVTKDGNTKYSLSDSDGKKLTKEQSEYFKDSKMRDDNGNLKVMYHGSQDAGFHTFDANMSDDDTSFFFVDRNDVAATYSGTYETYEAKAFRTVEDANKFFAEINKTEYEVIEKDGEYTLLDDGDEVATSDSLDEIYREFCDYEGVGYGDANYKVYLNLTNPLVIDAEGRNWNNITREYSQEIADRYHSLTAEEKAALTNLAEWGEYSIFKDEMLDARAAAEQGVSSGFGDVEFTKTLARAYAKLGGANANLYDAFSIASDNFSEDSIKEFAVKQMNTRDYAKKAKAEGYDGVIFKNIHDNGGYSNGSEGASTVAIAFESNQIKSVANDKPTGNKDIRYSLSDSEGAELSKEQQEYFKNSKIRNENGNLKVMHHGSPETFTVFDKSKAKSSGTYGKGFYFTDSTSHAATYGKSYDVYLNITNPLQNGTNDITKDQIRKFVEALAENEDYGIDNYGYDATIDSVTDSVYGKSDFAMILDLNISCVGNMVEAIELFNEVNGTDYNGIVAPTETVAFYPNQIKSIDNKAPTADKDIRYSLTEYTAEEKKAHNDMVLDHFGKTYKWAETGYLLLDGTRLDLSGKHDGAPGGYRTVDHRDITDALGYDYGGGDYSGSLIQFMSEGNIRIIPETNGINLSVKPTKAQEQALADFISRYRGEMMLDIDDLNGNTVVSVEYPKGTYYTKILNDIREWFDNGTKPEVASRYPFFSLSAEGEKQKRYGDLHISGEDVKLQTPANNDIAPILQETETELAKSDVLPDDLSAIAEQEANAMQHERLASLDDTDAPPEIEAPYYDEIQDAAPIDPFEDRELKEVSKDRKTPAYMYENPEVKPFFQAEANILLGEYERTEKPQTIYNGSIKYEMSYEFAQDIPEIYRTPRVTSEDIAYLRDTLKMSYNDIEKGLKAIIEDNGAENIAAAKKIEFLLNDRLLYGYRDFDGYDIPPNQEYINLLTEKQIREYSEEARKSFFDNADAYDPYADIAPTEEITPVKEQYEAIRPKPTNEPRMVRAGTAPRGKQRKWVGTSTESEAVDGKILPEDLDQNAITYQPISNKVTLNNANTKLGNMGYDAAVTYFNSQFKNKSVSLDDIALGERLIQEAIKQGDTKTAGELIQDVAILGTELGQKVQALSIIKRLTPEGQLKMLQKVVERGKTKGDKAYEGVEITQDMIDHILKTYGKDGSYDQNKLNKAVEDVKKQIADKMNVSKMDKVNAWRYLSMLGNPKTHIRNLVSNVAMKGTVAVKNAVARTIETFAPIKNRTKTWKRATDDVKAFAQQTALEMKDVLSDGGKYSEDASIKSQRQIFKNQILNGVYEFNSDLLSKEDWWFSKPAFTNALSEYLTANGISTKADIANNPEIVAKAKAYATEQSQIATFRQYSWLANKINEIERKNTATQMAVGAVLPFKKTPINIAKTGLNYSPLGFAKTLTYDIAQVKKGNMEASELVDHLSQNLTGTALTLVGYMLASAGFLNGAGDDDKEGKYDYQLGEQSYSITIGDNTYSLSWLTPVAMPLFVGANAYEQLVEGKEWNGDVVVQTLAQTLDPLSEMSFLSSLDSVLSSYDSGIEKFAGIGEAMIENYVTQFVPTLSSQIAAVTDDTKRTTKVGADSGFKLFDETINNLKYKIPGLRQTLEPTTDIWGNEVKQSENIIQRAVENFIAPYSRKENIATDIDEEIKDLFSQTGDDGVIPHIPHNYVNYDGEKYEMSAEEYTDFKKTYGQTAAELLEELFNTTMYENATSEERADYVNEVYDYASELAKLEYLDKEGVEFTNAEKDGEEYFKENSIKGAIENNLPPDEYEYSLEYPEKYKFLKDYGVSYDQWKASDEDAKDAYDWAFKNQDKLSLVKAVADDVVEYRKYASELYDIKADKDESGKSIVGSRKEKVLDYINNMDLDYGAKIILFKNEYNADDTYNNDIIEYLNSREDISYEEMESILKALGFTVDSNGNVYWD